MRLKDAIAHAGRVCSAFLICSLRFGDGVVPKGGVLPERRMSTSSSGSDEEDRQNAQQSNHWENRQSAAKDLREHGTSLGSTDDDEPSGSASCAESRLHALTQQLQAYGGCRQAHADICPDYSRSGFCSHGASCSWIHGVYCQARNRAHNGIQSFPVSR